MMLEGSRVTVPAHDVRHAVAQNSKDMLTQSEHTFRIRAWM